MSHTDRLTVFNNIIAEGMIPLFFNNEVDTAIRVTNALYEGGSRVLEFTNRGAGALEVMNMLTKHVAKNLPGMIIGIGSIEDAPTAALFVAHGAHFVVGPNFNPEIARLCNRRKIAYIPGCGSVTEIANAEEWGAEIIKVFPGGAVGGPDFIKNVLGPRPWSRLMPTGGVKAEEANLRTWFAAGVTCVGMGSDLVRKQFVQADDYDALSKLTEEILALIRTIRAG